MILICTKSPSGESAGLRVPMAGQNSCGQSHHICHGALYRAAQAPRTGRGRNAVEPALPPTDRHLGRDAANRLESLQTPDDCEDEVHLPSSEAALTQPPPTGRLLKLMHRR